MLTRLIERSSKYVKPIINSKSVWKSHIFILMLNIFIRIMKNKKQKIFRKIIETENANQDIIKETQKDLIEI